MSGFVEIGPLVPEKKIFSHIQCIGMATILVMLPGLFIVKLILPSYRCFIQNLALIGQEISEKKIFENVDGRAYGRTPARVPSYKLPMSFRLRSAKNRNPSLK